MGSVRYFVEDVDFKVPFPRKTAAWLSAVIARNKFKTGEINFIFCSDRYLLSMNKQYLNHTTLTDIITFSTSDKKVVLSGDIFISIDRIKDNAAKFQVGFTDELNRVMVHGVLHLMGFRDKTPREKLTMRKMEDSSLSLRK